MTEMSYNPARSVRIRIKVAAMGSSFQRVSSGTEWEQIVGFSRAIRVDRFVIVSGTTATDDDGNPVGVGDPAAQTDYIIRKIERALTEAGATLENVVRTRIYVTNADDWEAIGRVHGNYFGEVRPANTLVEVSRLVGDEYLVEIEADAILPVAREP
ncbi:RidA family protein [soil metagenome]